MPGRAAVLVLEVLQAQGEGELLRALQINQWAEVVVPWAHESKQRHHSQCRFGQRQDDAEENSQFVAAVDAGGFAEFVGDGQKELAKEKGINDDKVESIRKQFEKYLVVGGEEKQAQVAVS